MLTVEICFQNLLFTLGVLTLGTPEKCENFHRLILMSTKYPNVNQVPKLSIGVLGYLHIDIGVETALGAFCRQVLLRLASSAPQNLSAKCSFKSSTPKFMFEYTSPCKLGSVYSNINSGVLESESVKLSPFSGVQFI